MKITCNVKTDFLFGLLAGLLTFTLNSYVIGQDTVKAKSKKSVVRLKIKKDDNGKTTVIDTTFSLATPARSQGYDYEFEVPCPPDVPPPMKRREGFEGDYWPDRDMRTFQYENKRPTLSDILGDIPLDRVKSYSIKDRKKGKRIIIDIEDAPLIMNQDRMIFLRDVPSRRLTKPRIERKVIIENEPDDNN